MLPVLMTSKPQSITENILIETQIEKENLVPNEDLFVSAGEFKSSPLQPCKLFQIEDGNYSLDSVVTTEDAIVCNGTTITSPLQSSKPLSIEGGSDESVLPTEEEFCCVGTLHSFASLQTLLLLLCQNSKRLFIQAINWPKQLNKDWLNRTKIHMNKFFQLLHFFS